MTMMGLAQRIELDLKMWVQERAQTLEVFMANKDVGLFRKGPGVYDDKTGHWWSLVIWC